jgi:hypothetical protein
MGNRNGYFMLRWSHGGLDPNGKIIHVIKPARHHDRYYIIANTTTVNTPNNIISRKGNGNIRRETRWYQTTEELVHEDTRIPVIILSPRSSVLPQMNATSFIPIITPTHVQAPVVPVVPVVPVTPIVPKRYTMTTIPQHTILALLRDAAMQEEMCPITSDEIDVTNGAVTSCFHLFEKNAIMQWLLTPNSQNKCPVCNCPCNSYTLDEPPPLSN